MKIIRIIVLTVIFPICGYAQEVKFTPNYDETKVEPYELPDPLRFESGEKVKSCYDWELRRKEILSLFSNEIYGVTPVWTGYMTVEQRTVKENALNNTAIRKEVRLTLTNNGKSVYLDVILYLPRSEKPVPLFLGYNYFGNQSISNETDILLPASRAKLDLNWSPEKSRGQHIHRWPLSDVIKRGYGVASLYYGDVDTDYQDNYISGVHTLFSQERTANSWGSVAAWAWGLSRVMDYLVTDSLIDKDKIVVMGHSRQGKAALWAGAQDERFAIIISNNSGSTGAALAKRKFGETVEIINNAFPHWFCSNYRKYNSKEELLPIDQHELIALMAPRPVYVASAESDTWADPKGEFLSCVEASPVYEFLGREGIPAREMPKVHTPVFGTIGYHIRTGKHDIIAYDWKCFMDFADYHFGRR